ncbi:uncharacterized protein LOC135940561 [Cloeon dipterum]|uniref:uncharacterized protein LOC135940561 n=1 Tax=Cloeon dipterum TaxID=197152 RepID=UPI003220609F
MKMEMKEFRVQLATNKSAVATSLTLESDLLDIPLPLQDVESFKSFVARLNSEDNFHNEMMRLLVARSIHLGARPIESNQKRVAIVLKSNILPWLFAPQLVADLSLTKIKCWEGGKNFFKFLTDVINTSKLCSANFSMVESCFGDYCRRKGSEFRRVGKVATKRKTKSPNKEVQSPKKRPEVGSRPKCSTATSVFDPRSPKKKMVNAKVRRLAIESSCSDEEEMSSPLKRIKIRSPKKKMVNAKVRRLAIESSCSDEEEMSSPLKRIKIRYAKKSQGNLSSSDEALA